jgi:spermidine synthase
MLPKRERCRLQDMQDENANSSAGQMREPFEVRANGDALDADEQSGDEIYINRDTEIDGHWFICRGTVAEHQSQFQKIEILQLVKFGKALVLDGELQSVESDEYAYHEALVHPAMCLHAFPRRVLIIGGGEGAVGREVLKHASVEQAVMVDIDGEVVGLAHEHLRSWHQGVFADRRLRLIIGDGYEFVHGTDERFDVVFIDLVSSLDGGPADALYTRSFYETLKYRLTPGGVVVIQATECNTGLYHDHVRIRRNLEGVFAHLRSYAAFIPSYECPWGFIIASTKRTRAQYHRTRSTV